MESILIPLGLGSVLVGAFLEDRARRRLRQSNDNPLHATLPEEARIAARAEASREVVAARQQSRWLFVLGVAATLALLWV